MSAGFYNMMFCWIGVFVGIITVIGIQRFTMPSLHPIIPGQKWLIPGKGLVQIKAARSTFFGGYTTITTEHFTCFGSEWFRLNPLLVKEDTNENDKKQSPPTKNPDGTVVVKSF